MNYNTYKNLYYMPKPNYIFSGGLGLKMSPGFRIRVTTSMYLLIAHKKLFFISFWQVPILLFLINIISYILISLFLKIRTQC